MFKTKEKDAHDAAVESRVADVMWARLLANEDVIHKWQEVVEIKWLSFYGVQLTEILLIGTCHYGAAQLYSCYRQGTCTAVR